jgi:feruloyl esterase
LKTAAGLAGAAGRILSSAALAAGLAGCSDASGSGLRGKEACLALAKRDLGFAKVAASWQQGDRWADLLPFASITPAYCKIDATMKPVRGSTVRVVYRLPADWNGKVLGLGGGGWAGDVSLLSARDALARGFATMQTDAGKSSGGVHDPNVYDNTWLAYNSQAVRDFSYRAIHEMTVAGKQVAAAYYGRPPGGARFMGCSTGGRMALMEAQRYPEDYDEIVAGSPVYTLQTQTTALIASNLFAAPGAAMSAADLRLATRSAVAACDADDGAEDGVINDPRSCRWDPASIQCPGGKTSSCLTAPQVTALSTLYRGIRSPDGQWALWPISRGGEAAWGVFVNTGGEPSGLVGGSLGPIQRLIFPDREVDWDRFSAVTDAPQVRSSGFAEIYEAKDPDLVRFFARGGKLLMWSGESEVGPAPAGAIAYAEAVIAANPRAAGQFRFFLVPAMGHCGGRTSSEGLPFQDTLDAWTRSGEPPDTLAMRDGWVSRRSALGPRSRITRPAAVRAHRRVGAAWRGRARRSVEEVIRSQRSIGRAHSLQLNVRTRTLPPVAERMEEHHAHRDYCSLTGNLGLRGAHASFVRTRQHPGRIDRTAGRCGVCPTWPTHRLGNGGDRPGLWLGAHVREHGVFERRCRPGHARGLSGRRLPSASPHGPENLRHPHGCRRGRLDPGLGLPGRRSRLPILLGSCRQPRCGADRIVADHPLRISPFSRPRRPSAIGQRFGDMDAPDLLRPGEVGDRARHAQHAGVAARR